MKAYEVELNSRQYAKLEKMLNTDRAGQLARNQAINGWELFHDVIEYICMAVTDGWSTYEVVLKESEDELDLLKFLTKQIFPNDEDYFVKQIGKSFYCEKNFGVCMVLKRS